MRLPRPQIRDCCVHVTQRCQQREFLLKFAVDRQQYQRRLLQASRKFWRLRFLDYAITSNHVHLLLWVPRMSDLSEMMHWLQGSFARDYNIRKRREGAFWRGRFHPTLIQSGSHLSRCLFYLDMNMVRAGVVDHPFDWPHGGAQELCGARHRNRICDRARLLWCLGMPEQDEAFDDWYRATLGQLCDQWTTAPRREPYWSSAFAVGEAEWLNSIGGDIEDLTPYMEAAIKDGPETENAPKVLRLPQRIFLRLWKALNRKRH
ncbi:MAG: transposase [Lentisphaerae bacterium]|nr:transposase [Lentisphaerota bacterium]